MAKIALYYIDNILYFIAFCIIANGLYMYNTTLSMQLPKGLRYFLMLFFTNKKINVFIILCQIITIFNFIISFFNVIIPINLHISLDKRGHIGWLIGLQILFLLFESIDALLTYLFGKYREYKKYKKCNKWQ